MLEDRADHSVDYLAQNTDHFMEVARKRPELVRLNSSLHARVPQVFADVNRDKALKQGVELQDVYRPLRAFMGSLFVNYFNRFGAPGRSTSRRSPDTGPKPKRLRSFTSETPKARCYPFPR